MFPEQLFIDRADGIFSERNAMLYDSGRQKYELLLKEKSRRMAYRIV